MANKPDKRFLVFSFHLYESRGGMQDCVEDFDSLPEAINYILDDYDIDWPAEYQIYDRINGIYEETDFIKDIKNVK